MKTISSHVDEYISKRPFLKKYLGDKVINYRALARRIKAEIENRTGERVSVESLAISLLRLAKKSETSSKPIGTLKGVEVTSHVVAVTVNSPSPTLSEQIFATVEDFVGIVKERETTCLVMEKASYEQIEHLLGNNVAELESNLAALTITLLGNKHHQKTGSLSYPIMLLAGNGIPISYTFSNGTRHYLVIEEPHLDEAVRLLRTSLDR